MWMCAKYFYFAYMVWENQADVITDSKEKSNIINVCEVKKCDELQIEIELGFPNVS